MGKPKKMGRTESLSADFTHSRNHYANRSEEGQEVQEGDVLLILQAMKMNNKLAAPFSGKIKKIYVNSGDKIPKGTLMIEMEENEAV